MAAWCLGSIIVCAIYSMKTVHLSSDSYVIEIIDIKTGTPCGTVAIVMDVRQFLK